MKEIELSEDEEWMVESLIRNLVYDSNAQGNITLESRFYTKMLRKYGCRYTERLIRSIHEGVTNIQEAIHAN